MAELPGSRCESDMIADIQCRTVDTHLTPKETGLDVECSLERGLVCTSRQDEDECPDFEIRVKCQCKETVTVSCDPSQPLEAHVGDCYLYHGCDKTDDGNSLVVKTCGPDLMFNPKKLKCDFPSKVILVKPECEVSTTAPVTTPACDVHGPNIADPSDCYLYYRCEQTDNGYELVRKTCYPDFMFNTETLQCDFSMKVGELRPECHETVTEACDVGEPSKPHSSDCYLYYSCIEKENKGAELVGQNCGPNLMFNPAKLKCDFPENVGQVRPECVFTIKPATEVCAMDEPNRPHAHDCSAYYKCEKTEEGNDLVEKICESGLMFNPISLQCDSEESVGQVRPECVPSTTRAPSTTVACNVDGPNVPDLTDCYKFYRCEDRESGVEMVTKTCYPEFMFDTVSLKCEFPEQVAVVRPECEIEVPISPVCDASEPNKPHPSDCFLYYRCEEKEEGSVLVGRTCGPMLMFNPATLKCDSPGNVAKVKPECKITKPQCDMNEPNRADPTDCYQYLKCEDTEDGILLVKKTCADDLMFNPVSLECDSPDNVAEIKPECEIWRTRLPTTQQCDVSEPNRPGADCYTYHRCEERDGVAVEVQKSCKPEFMFNPETLQCDFPDNVGVIKEECIEVIPTVKPTCDVSVPNKPHPSDCYLYYRCEETETGGELIGRTCGPMLMFNSAKLKCDFPHNVAKVRPECAGVTSTSTEATVTAICEMTDAKLPHVSDCHIYYVCEETEVGNDLAQKTCGSMLMFNPMTLKCDFPLDVAKVRPECAVIESTTVTTTGESVATTTSPLCDVHGENEMDHSDCYKYYHCEERENGLQVVTKTCYPEFMFNPITMQCDFAEHVLFIRPECHDEPIVHAVCDTSQPNKPHPSDCYLYYRCEATADGGELTGRTCGPMLMFNSAKLKCDFPSNVVKIRPECGATVTTTSRE
ncbi:uncharacterized protein LOC116176191 [Photinus pyralis]|uniref:uncharacterized protein LOC116176191 n=1 Tax=Photinus pyralis TaxID=7054 RepID=UPI0012674EDA|nr:uncharacterized protein LOC116176191 [Photinus pyralis]